MATHTTLSSLFADIANAIRAKTGSSETIVADGFPDAIASISTTPTIRTISGALTDSLSSDGSTVVADLSSVDNPQIDVNVFPMLTQMRIRIQKSSNSSITIPVTWAINSSKKLVITFDFSLSSYLQFYKDDTQFTVYILE